MAIPPLLFTKPAAEEDPTEPSNAIPTQVPTVTPTVIPTAAPTAEPTQEPTVAPTEEPKPPKYSGWELLSPGMEFTRNADGIIVLAGAYYNHWINGFLIADTGVDFLSFHSGEPVWLTGKQEQITIHHEASTYTVEFVWCSHMGEVAVNYVGRTIQNQTTNGITVMPIAGNDQFVRVGIPDGKQGYWYLLDLQNLTLSDPLSKVDPKHYRNIEFYLELSPNANAAIFVADDLHERVLWNFADGSLTPLEELTGIKDVNQAFWVSGTQLAVVSTRDMGPEVTYADAVLYDLTDGSIKELYKNARYGWFRDMGGLEHKGRMYCYYDKNTKETVFVDAITGATGRTGHGYPWAKMFGYTGIEYYDKDICYLVKTDCTVTPLFTTRADP